MPREEFGTRGQTKLPGRDCPTSTFQNTWQLLPAHSTEADAVNPGMFEPIRGSCLPVCHFCMESDYSRLMCKLQSLLAAAPSCSLLGGLMSLSLWLV